MVSVIIGMYFARVYGGGNNDEAFRLHSDSSGYYITGSSWSYTQGNDDYLIMKVDTLGELVWAIAVGDTGGELGLSIAGDPSSSGGIVVAGGTTSYGAGYWDIFIGTVDENGHLTGAKVLGGPDADGATGIIPTSDGGFFLCGATRSWGQGDNVLLVKLDASLNPIWARSIGGSGNEGAVSAVEVDDGFIVVGLTSSWGSGYDDMLVLKVSTEGQLLWAEAVGGVWDDTAYAVIRTEDGFLVGGVSSSAGMGNLDIVLLKFTNNGGLIWAKTYGGPEFDKLFNAKEVAGGILLVGATESYFGQDADLLLLKVDSQGHVLWATGLGGDSTDYGADVTEIPTGFLVLGGYESQGAGGWDYFLMSLDWNGEYQGCVFEPDGLSERDIIGELSVFNIYSAEVVDVQLEVSDAPFVERDVTVQVSAQDICEPQSVREGREAAAWAMPARGGIRVWSQTPVNLEVFRPDGRLVKSLPLNGSAFIPLKKGVYIWRAGGSSGVTVAR